MVRCSLAGLQRRMFLQCSFSLGGLPALHFFCLSATALGFCSGKKGGDALRVRIIFLLLHPASEEAGLGRKVAKGHWKGGGKWKCVVYSDLRESSKNFEIKFGEYEKFPTFATRYGGNDERKERKGRRGWFDIRELKSCQTLERK